MSFIDDIVLGRVSDATHYVPASISDYRVGNRAVLGGGGPAGVTPRCIYPLTKHLVTLPFADRRLSVFYTFDMSQDGAWNPFDNTHVLFDEANHLVQFVINDAREGEGYLGAGNLPRMGLDIGLNLRPDGPYDDEVSYPFHKIGGIPCFTRLFEDDFYSGCGKIMNQAGYVHLLQLAFPSGPNDVLIDADWPFGDAIFHIFMKSGPVPSFKYCWG